jgi:hypothetical protein
MSSPPDFFYISGGLILLSLAVIVAILINRRRKRARKRVLQGSAPASKKWEKPEAWGIVVAFLTLASSTAIGVAQLVDAQGVPSPGSNGPGSTSYVDQGIPVEGRAASPSDITEGPLTIANPGAKIGITNLAGVSKTITFRDWNTIVATSMVPEEVNLIFDSSLKVSPASVRRLQYLADLMGMQDGAVDFGAVEYVRISGDTVLAFVLAVNGRPNAVNITGLHAIVWDDHRSHQFLNADFYSETQPLFVPAKTSLFTYLVFNKKTPASFGSGSYHTDYYTNYTDDLPMVRFQNGV